MHYVNHIATVNCIELNSFAQRILGIDRHEANALFFRSGFWPNNETNLNEFYLDELVDYILGWEHDIEDSVEFFNNFDIEKEDIDPQHLAAALVGRFLIESGHSEMAFLFDD